MFVYCSDVGGGLDSTLWIQVRLATSNSPFCRGQQLGTALSAPTIHQSWSLLQAGVEVVNTCQARETWVNAVQSRASAEIPGLCSFLVCVPWPVTVNTRLSLFLRKACNITSIIHCWNGIHPTYSFQTVGPAFQLFSDLEVSLNDREGFLKSTMVHLFSATRENVQQRAICTHHVQEKCSVLSLW